MAYFNLTRSFYGTKLNGSRLYSSVLKRLELRKCCQVLGVTMENNLEQIRDRYIELAKKFHPDSGSKLASNDKFEEIDRAFRTILNEKKRETWEVKEEVAQEIDIKHTAPQHRQYLSYDGYGSGTPFERQKQYTKYRAIQAADNVMKHKVNKITAEENALMAKSSKRRPDKHDIKTKYGFDRLVEDLIQESMSKGEFSNLPGCGKPLKYQNRNPYVDFTTHKLNEVLIDNGFTPEWIMLNKEIKEDLQKLRTNLQSERRNFGQYPLPNEDEKEDWIGAVYKYENDLREINKKIDKFNLVVPILDKQMVRIDLYKESEKALMADISPVSDINVEQLEDTQKRYDTSSVNPYMNVLDFIGSLFKKP